MENLWIFRGGFRASPTGLVYAVRMIYCFGNFELDLATGELREDGEAKAVQPQVFALIAFLVENRDRLVSREEIFENVWDGRVVTDSALTSRIKFARQALGDDGRTQRFIKTLHGKGLRFVAPVQVRREPAVRDLTEPISEAGQDADAACRPSIAVLPFHTIGDAGAWVTIADGLPHELIAELSRLRWLFVVARASSFRLRAPDVDPLTVGQLLGVRYCLSGAVEMSGKRLDVTVELSDTRSGDIVWAERYSGSVDELHAVREQIRASILSQLEVRIPLHEASAARLRVSENLDAWSAYHLALQHIYRFNSRDNAIAASLFGQAVAQDPGFARAHAGLSFVHFQNAFLQQTDDIAAEIEKARQSAHRGVDLDPLDPFVNFAMGRTFWLDADIERALSWLGRATSLSPNYAQGLCAEGVTRVFAGTAVEARGNLDSAMQLSPLDPLYYAMLASRGFTHIALGEYREAVQWTERGARSPGAHVLIPMIAAVANDLAGDAVRARAWADEVRRRRPQLASADFFRSFPMQDASMRSRLAGALESVGF